MKLKFILDIAATVLLIRAGWLFLDHLSVRAYTKRPLGGILGRILH